MKEETLVTIVIPVMNRAAVVERTLDSIAAQTHRPLRLVIVDNASDDLTPEIIGRWADANRAEDFHITLVNEPRRGVCAARNRGLQEVTTDYVMFFDSDDVMEDNHLARIDAFLHTVPQADIVHWSLSLRDADGWTVRKDSRSYDLLAEQIMHSTLGTARYCVRTSLLRDAGGWDESLRMWNDYELGVRLLTCAMNPVAVHLPGPPSAIHCDSDDSLTGPSFSSRAEDQEAALGKIERLLGGADERYKLLLSARRAVLAADYRREGSAELGSSQLTKALAAVNGRDRLKIRTIYLLQRLTGSAASSLAMLFYSAKPERK